MPSTLLNALVKLALCSLALTVGVLGCGEETKVTIEDHANALTSEPGDSLFTLTISGEDASYTFAKISVLVVTPDGDNLSITCDHDDSNSDKAWDDGESIICQEPGINIFSETDVDKDFAVDVHETSESGVLIKFASLVWTPTT